MNVWSFGGGVQSCAIAALIVRGELEPPDLALIADTHFEKSTTWEYLNNVINPALGQFKVERIAARDFATVGLYGGKNKDSLLIPAFTNINGTIGKLPAYCSNEWKTRVIDRWLRKYMPTLKIRTKWLGFSIDEMKRVQPDESRWKKRYPLIEKRMNRGDCVALVERMGWPTPPRSSCNMCPNHTQVEWRDIRDNKPEDWKDAVAFDKSMRLRDPHVFLHSDCVPLDEADLDDKNESLFGERCDSGVCFV